GLVETLRGLARQHNLAILMSTHELELALRVADRVWLLDAAGTLRDAIPEAHDSRRSALDRVLAELSSVSPYFAVGTGPAHEDGWRPVQQLFTDTALLAEIVGRVQARIDATEQRVAASTFFLDFAARLWSIGLGALAGHRLLPDFAPEHLLFREAGGQIQLHIQHPVAWQGDDLEPLLLDIVLESHLAPLTAALRRLGRISEKLLVGNAAAALLGAADVFDRHTTSKTGWRLARTLCTDERLSDAIRFSETGYRRTSCCLYYRAPGGGLCGDCVLTSQPRQRRKVAP
ncbi:MAG: (2Fe-2S)-binding protein, partial [Mycobacterium sp.]